MSDTNSGVRQLIQDLIAPDLKAISSEQDATEKQMMLQHNLLMKTLEAFRAEMRSEFALVRAEFRIEIQSQIAPLKEWIAVLESHAS
jgi:hypothetical protein